MEKEKNKKKGGTFFLIAAIVFAVVFVFSGVMLFRETAQLRQESQSFSYLKSLQGPHRGSTDSGPSASPSPSGPHGTGKTEEGQGEEPAPSPGTQPGSQTTDGTTPPVVLEWQAPLRERNPEYFAWITIPGTNIDYPVMYSPSRPNFYLNHDFDGHSAKAGVPYMVESCDPNGSYFLVHGHRLTIGTMFSHLTDYEKKDFWASHRLVHFDTLYEERTYEVVIAIKTRVFDWDESGFRYYNYYSLKDEDTFNEYMSQARASALYDTGIDVSYGDELLVLSTCYRYTRNGRFMIIAKRIS